MGDLKGTQFLGDKVKMEGSESTNGTVISATVFS